MQFGDCIGSVAGVSYNPNRCDSIRDFTKNQKWIYKLTQFVIRAHLLVFPSVRPSVRPLIHPFVYALRFARRTAKLHKTNIESG